MSDPIFEFSISLPREVAFLPIARHVVEVLCGIKIISEDVGPDSVTYVVEGQREDVLRKLMPETVMPIHYGVSIEILKPGERPPTPGTEPPPPKHFLIGKTNQDVINLFGDTFGSAPMNGQPAYIDAIMRAQLIHIASNRLSQYSGPAVEDMPGLTTAEKDRLIRTIEEGLSDA